MSSLSEPSIITLEKPERIERWHTAGLAPWSWCMTTGMCGYISTAASIRWRRNGSPAYFLAPAEACMITGEFVSSAACMIAWICSKLLTLNAGTPYEFSAAWSSNCRIEIKAIDPFLKKFSMPIRDGHAVTTVMSSRLLRLAAFADLDDLHRIGPAGRADRFAERNDDQIAFMDQAGSDQLFFRFLQQMVAIVADVLDHQRIDVTEQAQAIARRNFGRQRVNRHAAIESRNPQRCGA